MSSDPMILIQGKMFIGGLASHTTEMSLRAYFACFGDVQDPVIMRDKETNTSRGFGFISFMDSDTLDMVLSIAPHIVDGKQVDCKRAVPKDTGAPVQVAQPYINPMNARKMPQQQKPNQPMMQGGTPMGNPNMNGMMYPNQMQNNGHPGNMKPQMNMGGINLNNKKPIGQQAQKKNNIKLTIQQQNQIIQEQKQQIEYLAQQQQQYQYQQQQRQQQHQPQQYNGYQEEDYSPYNQNQSETHGGSYSRSSSANRRGNNASLSSYQLEDSFKNKSTTVQYDESPELDGYPDQMGQNLEAQYRKVFVGGLPHNLSDEEFTEYFAQYGEIEDSAILKDKRTGKPRGFGFVTYKNMMTLRKVMELKDQHVIQGKWVDCKEAVPQSQMRDVTGSEEKEPGLSEEPLQPQQQPPNEYQATPGGPPPQQFQNNFNPGSSPGPNQNQQNPFTNRQFNPNQYQEGPPKAGPKPNNNYNQYPPNQPPYQNQMNQPPNQYNQGGYNQYNNNGGYNNQYPPQNQPPYNGPPNQNNFNSQSQPFFKPGQGGPPQSPNMPPQNNGYYNNQYNPQQNGQTPMGPNGPYNNNNNNNMYPNQPPPYYNNNQNQNYPGQPPPYNQNNQFHSGFPYSQTYKQQMHMHPGQQEQYPPHGQYGPNNMSPNVEVMNKKQQEEAEWHVQSLNTQYSQMNLEGNANGNEDRFRNDFDNRSDRGSHYENYKKSKQQTIDNLDEEIKLQQKRGQDFETTSNSSFKWEQHGQPNEGQISGFYTNYKQRPQQQQQQQQQHQYPQQQYPQQQHPQQQHPQQQYQQQQHPQYNDDYDNQSQNSPKSCHSYKSGNRINFGGPPIVDDDARSTHSEKPPQYESRQINFALRHNLLGMGIGPSFSQSPVKTPELETAQPQEQMIQLSNLNQPQSQQQNQYKQQPQQQQQQQQQQPPQQQQAPTLKRVESEGNLTGLNPQELQQLRGRHVLGSGKDFQFGKDRPSSRTSSDKGEKTQQQQYGQIRSQGTQGPSNRADRQYKPF